MKNEEKELVGNLEDEIERSEIILVGCLRLVLVLFLSIILFIIFITKWSPADLLK